MICLQKLPGLQKGSSVTRTLAFEEVFTLELLSTRDTEAFFHVHGQ